MSAFFTSLFSTLISAISLLFPVAATEAPAADSLESFLQGTPYYEDFYHERQETILPTVDFVRLQKEFAEKDEQTAKQWFRLFGNQLVEDDFQFIFSNYPRLAFVYDSQTGEFRGITDEGVMHLGFSYNKKTSLFYATKNPWMRSVGFNKAYDWFGDDVSGIFDLITRRVRFEYNGLDYQIQIWKGQYFLKTCLGAEVGIYTKPQDRLVEHYDCYPLDKMMPMTLKLYTGDHVYYDLPAEDHWWVVMMAHRGPKVGPHQLTMENSIDFSNDPGLGEAFYEALQEECPDFTITKDGDTVWFCWQATE